MQYNQLFKIVDVIDPASYSAGTSTDGEIDTLGFNYCTIVVKCGAMQAALTECAVTEGDTTGSATDAISALTLGNAACLDVEGTACALSNTDDDDIVVFHIDLGKRKRFLQLNTTAATGGASVYTAFAVLSRGTEMAAAANSSYAGSSAGGGVAVIV